MIRRFFARLPVPWRSRAALLLLLLLTPAGAPRLFAQASDPVAAASQRADALFDRRQYPEAATAYAAFLQAYPNSEFAPAAQFHLAYAQFLSGQSQPAVDLLRKLQAAPGTPPEMQEDVALLLPQALAQGAGTAAADADRSAGFTAALQAYDAFITKFPRSASLESALYGRAVVNYQLANYPDAVRDLNRNLASYPNSDTVLDSEYLLAFTIATQSNLALGNEKLDAAGRAAALQGYVDAENHLRAIIARNTDLALANDAQFQLGETLLAHAGAVPAAAQDKLYQAALSAYRAVQPKAPLLAAQTARLERFSQALLAERRLGAGANRDRVHQLDGARLREAGKLGQLQARDDPALSARLHSGEVFGDLNRYDEARLLMSALLPTATRAEDRKLALNYIALTYVGQGLVAQAVTAYDTFQTQFPGDPLAETLPLAMAGLFQSGPKADPAQASHYLDEFSRLYPQSRLRDTMLLEQAAILSSQGHYDDALKRLDTFLKGNPPRALAATAELTRAQTLLDKGDLSNAAAAFTKVRDTYKDRPEAEDANFRLAYAVSRSGDSARAVKLSQDFLTQYPQSKLVPAALTNLALSQQAAGSSDQALATLVDLSTRFPQSPEGSAAYFQRANIDLANRKYDDMAQVLTEFLAKYPASDQAYEASQRIASVREQAKQPDAAAALYQKFVTAQPQSPHAPEALAQLAELWRRTALALGSYVVLAAPQRDVWKTDLARSVAASEQQLAQYPEAPATALGLQTLLACQRLLITAKAKTPAQVADYFHALADKYQQKAAARSRILFRLAALTAETDPAQALRDMRAAYDPAVVYSPADLDLYTRELLPVDPAAAADVFAKLAQDYSLPPGGTPAQAPPDVQEAQAIVLSGQGQIAQAAGKPMAAEAAFSRLKRDYPLSSKVPDANLGLAEGLVAGGKLDAALPLLAEVAMAQAAPLNARARALFLNGKIQAAKGQDGAIDAYLKVAAFYPNAPDAPEGLWLGGQALEKQAATLGDTPARTGGPTRASQLARARKAYEDLTTHYGSSKWSAPAKQRLAALPAATHS